MMGAAAPSLLVSLAQLIRIANPYLIDSSKGELLIAMFVPHPARELSVDATRLSF